MPTFLSHSPTETFALGVAWGEAARAGWIVGLAGELGAGKTQLVKGLARGLGSPARVHSPTFALVNEYAGGRLPLVHLDLFRLETAEQRYAAGLDEFLQRPDTVVVVEWFDRWPELEALADRAVRRVWIESVTEDERRIRYEDAGP